MASTQVTKWQVPSYNYNYTDFSYMYNYMQLQFMKDNYSYIDLDEL